MLVEISTDSGVTGWGEAYGFPEGVAEGVGVVVADFGVGEEEAEVWVLCEFGGDFF